MSLTLVAPGLLAAPAAMLATRAGLRALARLAAPRTDEDGLESATLRALGIDAPVAPLVALGAGLDADEAGWLCADPVTLVAGREDVRLLGRVDDLSREEAEALRGRLQDLFADDGLAFHVPRPDRWLVAVRGRALPDTATLARATGVPLRAQLPTGHDAGTWRRWQNEVQMLLHDDPVNAAREAAGRAPVSGLWFWGGGRAPRIAARIDAIAGPGRDADLVRGVVRMADGEASDDARNLPEAWPPHPLVVVVPRIADERAVEAFASGWVEPALDALARGAVDSVTLVADAHAGPAATWAARRASWLGRWRARWSRADFVVPVASRASGDASSAAGGAGPW